MKRTPLKPGKPLRRKSGLKPGGRLKRRSAKRQCQYDEYLPERRRFLAEHPVCQVAECDRPSCDIHHQSKRNGDRLVDKRYWMAVCRQCHNSIGANPDWAYEEGYLIRVNRG